MDTENTATKRNYGTILTLFLTFLKIGAFTFGGGYAMIPLIQKEICEKQGWIKDEDILDIIAIAESTPGPIAINSATFVGFRICGFWGAFFSTLGVVLPSFIIISIISLVLKEFEHLKVVKYAFFGIRAGILALILKALYSMYKECPKNIMTYAVMAFSLMAVSIFKVNVLLVIVICAIIGLVYSLYILGRAKK